MIPIDQEVIVKAVATWGPELQIGKLVEELGELTIELVKNEAETDLVIDEMADVIICLNYIPLCIHGYTKKKLKERIKFKMDRLKQRIEDERTKNNG